MYLAKSFAFACAALALSATPAGAQQAWKLASAPQPGSVLVGFVDETAAKIPANSGGAIKAERQFIGSEQEIIQQLVRGRLVRGRSHRVDQGPVEARRGGAGSGDQGVQEVRRVLSGA